MVVAAAIFPKLVPQLPPAPVLHVQRACVGKGKGRDRNDCAGLEGAMTYNVEAQARGGLVT